MAHHCVPETDSLTKIAKPRESWVNPKVEIGLSPIHARGILASSPITEGEVIVIWGGPLVGKKEADRARVEGKVAMQLDDGLYSVEERGEDSTYFMNHSCGPNVWMEDGVIVVTRRDIGPGEELTVDYALFEASASFRSTWECVCGSTRCRGRVTGQDWQGRELQQRYAGHFLPLIARRIEAMHECGNRLRLSP